MNTWQQHIGKTYLINIPARIDRLRRFSREVEPYGIDFEVVAAMPNKNGKIGLLKTMIALFERAHGERILVFEDDVRFDVAPVLFNDVMTSAVSKECDLLFLGANINRSFAELEGDHLVRLTGCFANHAVIYSPKAIDTILNIYQLVLRRLENGQLHDFHGTDTLLDQYVVRHGNSYITNPMLCTQHPDWSDIENKQVNKNHVWQRYDAAMKTLMSKG